MTTEISPCCTAFDGNRRVASGTIVEVVLAARRALDAGAAGPLLFFDDRTGRALDFDLRGTEDELRARLADPTAGVVGRRPGRPKLGVAAREVTLLPRHWAWLAEQRGGASAALRRLVEQASRAGDGTARARQAKEAVDHFMLAMTGNLAGHEEALRALYRGDRERFLQGIREWPSDVRDHIERLAAPAWPDSPAPAKQETR
jgi:hypothetical protein